MKRKRIIYMFLFFSALLLFKIPVTTITKLFWPLESRGETWGELQVLALPLPLPQTIPH